MTTAVIKNSLNNERPLTETEILRMRDVYVGDYLPEVTTERVEELTKAIKEAFRTLVNHYIQIRGPIDPTFHGVPEIPDEDPDPDEDDPDEEFDFYGDIVIIEWREWDRCGDRDYFRREFPLAHLWTPNWEAAITAEVEKRKEGERVKQMVEKAKQAAAHEARERAQLSELLNKYGVPEDYLARPGHS